MSKSMSVNPLALDPALALARPGGGAPETEGGRLNGAREVSLPTYCLVEMRPYSFRLPEGGEVDQHFGLSRAFWAELIRSTPTKPPQVESFILPRRQDKWGIRCIDYSSARAWVEHHRKTVETYKFQFPKGREGEFLREAVAA